MFRFPPRDGSDKKGKYRIISWVACANMKLKKCQKPTSIDNPLNSAMRYAIRRQISKYKNSHPIKNCELCYKNNNIPKEIRVEVDHFPEKFVSLKNNFIAVQNLKDKSPPTSFKSHPKRGSSMFKDGNKDNDYYDKKWKQAWQRYHNKRATYRYLCPDCNKRN